MITKKLIIRVYFHNRNLQAAICSYYDYEQPNAKVPCMAFVKDVTIGEGESVPPGTRFVKTWRIQNIGMCFIFKEMLVRRNFYLYHIQLWNYFAMFQLLSKGLS